MKDPTHLIANLTNVKNIEDISSKQFIKDFILKVVDLADMKAIIDPVVIYYDHEEKIESGVTGIVIIADSHISIHTYPYKKSVYFDLFSCKYFDDGLILNYLREVFPDCTINSKLFKR